MEVGIAEGSTLGTMEGICDGMGDGKEVGVVGAAVGRVVSVDVGSIDGHGVGDDEGYEGNIFGEYDKNKKETKLILYRLLAAINFV